MLTFSSPTPTLASEVGYALRQILTLHPTHPLTEVFSSVSEEGTVERTRLSEHMTTWSAHLRRPLSNPRIFLNKERTQACFYNAGRPMPSLEPLSRHGRICMRSYNAVERQRGDGKDSPASCLQSSPRNRNATRMRSRSGNRRGPGSTHRNTTA
ncbi:hypothetical protein KSB_49070 [Ktedonobacter robiniae]|uniref:Uncharacterized protein n=1 Tax=Ktedonobacter robiniae TaxID=2778365 RepID=A0ABQ3UV18_9CHLR|nr:hypothetical protein KSB_49070 [Ktedonobacter robiniae]